MRHTEPDSRGMKSTERQFHDLLCQELMSMQGHDQIVRSTISVKYAPGVLIEPDDLARWTFVDRVNTARMKEIVAQYGWPGHSLVGEEGALAAWLLVQHADEDVGFQKHCLELLRTAVAAGEASAKHLAFLTDRVRVNEGKPQLYGTQLKARDGNWESADIEDVARLDERRAAVGLGPLPENVPTRNA